MIRTLKIFLLSLLIFDTKGQPLDTLYHQLYSQFAIGYYQNLEKNQYNFYTTAEKQLRNCLNRDNVLAWKARRQLMQTDNINDSIAAERIAQKLIGDLVERQFYDDAKDKMDAWKPMFDHVVDKMCPCMTDKYKTLNTQRTDVKPDFILPCLQVIQNDQDYIAFMRQHLAGANTAELAHYGQLANRYLTAHCRALREFTIEQIPLNVSFDWYQSVKRHVFMMPYNVIDLYKRNSIDSLTKFFPGFKKFEAELAKAVRLKDGGGFYWSEKSKTEDRNGTFTHILESKTGNQVFGKIIYRLSTNDEQAVVLSFTTNILKTQNQPDAEAPPQIERIGALDDVRNR